MSKLEEEIDKNLSQMKINYELLDNQGGKINKIYNGLEHIEHNNSISQKILKRLNNLFYRFINPLKIKELIITNLSGGAEDNTINQEDNTINLGEKDSDDIIMDKIFLMKNIAYKMNEKIDEQNELLYETQEKMDSCNKGIKKNSKLISELI
tara:strand:+ start:413 stop:868 length:456 start_codon:yes stop_codon:yes gene_type:complete